MFVIANNITTRHAKVDQIFRQAKTTGWDPDQTPARALRELVRQCNMAGAGGIEINIQQHHHPPEAMEFAVKIVQQSTSCQLVLSTNNAEALEAGLRACKQHLPVANYIAVDEARLRDMLPLIARYGAEVILLVTNPAMPAEARDMLKAAAVLVGAANEVGIPNDHILVDPGILHITTPAGQQHLGQVIEFLTALPEAFDPPVRSTCWLNNVSAGAGVRLRPFIEMGLLALLGGLGLSSVFLDVFNSEHMRMAKLIDIFRNKVVYADGVLKA